MKSIIESIVAIIFIILAYTIPVIITFGGWCGILWLISLIEYEMIKELLALTWIVMLLLIVAIYMTIIEPWVYNKLNNI